MARGWVAGSRCIERCSVVAISGRRIARFAIDEIVRFLSALLCSRMALVRAVGRSGLLLRREGGLCPDVQAAPDFRSLAAQRHPDGGAPTNTETRLVDFVTGSATRSLVSPAAKRCSGQHGFLLVHQ